MDELIEKVEIKESLDKKQFRKTTYKLKFRRTYWMYLLTLIFIVGLIVSMINDDTLFIVIWLSLFIVTNLILLAEAIISSELRLRNRIKEIDEMKPSVLFVFKNRIKIVSFDIDDTQSEFECTFKKFKSIKYNSEKAQYEFQHRYGFLSINIDEISQKSQEILNANLK